MNPDISGTWHLTSFEQININTKQKSYPLGKNPVGLLIYTDDGNMSVNMMSSDRKRFSKNDIMSGKDDEIISAYKTYNSYSGKYEIINNKIIHKILVASFPNYVGTEQVRYFRLEDKNTLILETPEILVDNDIQVAYITWKRDD